MVAHFPLLQSRVERSTIVMCLPLNVEFKRFYFDVRLNCPHGCRSHVCKERMRHGIGCNRSIAVSID